MGVSDRIIDWIERYDALEKDLSVFNKAVRDVKEHGDPFAFIELTRARAGTNPRFKHVMPAWDRLKGVFDGCRGNLTEKFDAVQAEIDKGGIPEFVQKIIAKHASVVSDVNNAFTLVERGNELEEKAQSFVNHSTTLGKELTEYVHGNMVFSFDAQICYDNHFSILGGEPINYVTHKGKITQFPGQNYKDIGQRFLDAASADGYDYFWFSGMMDDGNYSSLQHVLGNIGGKIAHARNIMQDIDLSKVHTLGLTFSDRDREKMPRYTLPNMKVESIGLSRYGGEDISFQEDLDRRRTDVSTPGNECARNLANILDHVAESYRA